MSPVYSDTEPRSTGGFQPYHLQNAVRAYLRHYENYMFLDFMVHHSDINSEKNQASRELTICERKLKHWSQHANFVLSEATLGIQDIKKKWNKA